MFEHYIPKRFCRELVEAQGHSTQLPVLMAVAAGLKPCADVWVRAGRLKKFTDGCRKYGIKYRADVNFNTVTRSQIPGNIIGKGNLTTTFAYGRPFDPRLRSGEVHLFISRSSEALEAGFRYGWYPVIVNGRVMEKPLADGYRFGLFLGYPDCCVDFFQKYNDWSQYNFLLEILRNTKYEEASFLCNPFPRDRIYAYIPHMPCSYGCEKTKLMAGRLRDVILKEEPIFARKIDQHLQMPFLVFYERKVYAFDGELKRGNIYYRQVYHSGNGADYNPYEQDLCQGDRLALEGRSVVILKKGRRIKILTPPKVDFGQENPFFAQFSSRGMSVVCPPYQKPSVPAGTIRSGSIVRVPNRIGEGVQRRDALFPYLTVTAFRDPARFERLRRGLTPSFEDAKSELSWAMKGYFFYLQEDYCSAVDCFIEAVIFSPENFDNWNDLAFALRHAGEYSASEKVIFQAPELIRILSGCRVNDRRRKIASMIQIGSRI